VEGGRVLYANRIFAKNFGCDSAAIEGKPLAQLVTKTPLPVQMIGEPFFCEGREFTVVCVRESAPAPKIRRHKASLSGTETVGRLVSGVAHDFNNLLTGILLYCDLLSASLESNTRVQRQVREMRAAGEQGGALIQQLLTLARNQAAAARPLSWNDT